jgi:hypothetical protein
MFGPRLLLLVAIGVSANAQAPVGIRVLLGVTDTESTPWDGGVRAQGASAVSIEPWRFEGTMRWMETAGAPRLILPGVSAGANQAAPPPVIANGVVITLSGADSAVLDFETAQGAFQIRTDEIAYGRFVLKLNGRVLADRVPPSTPLAAR